MGNSANRNKVYYKINMTYRSLKNGGGGGSLGRRRGSRSKKSKEKWKSLEEAQLEIQELGHSLNRSNSLRSETIEEESFHPPDGAIAKNSFVKYNKTFHKFFRDIPTEEKLTHVFTCALQKEVLYHGKLFVSVNYVCFYSSVLLKDTKLGEQVENGNSSPHFSGENGVDGVDRDTISSNSSREDSVERSLPIEAVYSDLPSSADSWVWIVTERVKTLLLIRDMRNLNVLLSICLFLAVLLILSSGYIGLRIVALEEQLSSLGALPELSIHLREEQETA
ncbi:unnamed protein product [Oncorhynchus mykiss]|uniref:GRAM domain-containing protein n=1 Tax=Oncorhynchus mykiss TaxID=8022 RepID=A0A060XUV8_ONCMY|nr:unnamed protein product [Oncorhynchus mykiss]